MPRAVYLELGSLFKPTVALWKQAQTQRCSVKHSHSPSCRALYSTLSSETQCKQISWSTAKEWRIKAYLPVFSNYLLVPKLQSIRTLKTNLSYSLDGFNLLIFLFLLHPPLYFKRQEGKASSGVPVKRAPGHRRERCARGHWVGAICIWPLIFCACLYWIPPASPSLHLRHKEWSQTWPNPSMFTQTLTEFHLLWVFGKRYELTCRSPFLSTGHQCQLANGRMFYGTQGRNGKRILSHVSLWPLLWLAGDLQECDSGWHKVKLHFKGLSLHYSHTQETGLYIPEQRQGREIRRTGLAFGSEFKSPTSQFP